ncbi:hypothetical protein [Aquabacterium parvum]|jgi:hypothetical protein|uniref:hypothetical protein n=1 Tax=Aquabacterium parvum TaxID=70584 RepID=UPI000718C767|nr:hypothetical protein [Aquabacterium parvum]MBU0916693.1 hypothetical protein [Gammaproteobacteria bacterium]
MSDRSPSTPSVAPVKARLLQLLDEVIAHDGYGSIKVDVRLLKKGQKEVIVDCGKQYRFVVNHPGSSPGAHEAA